VGQPAEYMTIERVDTQHLGTITTAVIGRNHHVPAVLAILTKLRKGRIPHDHILAPVLIPIISKAVLVGRLTRTDAYVGWSGKPIAGVQGQVPTTIGLTAGFL